MRTVLEKDGCCGLTKGCDGEMMNVLGPGERHSRRMMCFVGDG